MALINCPECNREISDNAKSCPHCGYSIKKEQTKTELGNVETNAAMGVLYIFLGIVSIIGGLFLLGIIIGIFAILGGLALISIGSSNISGIQNGICPYCNSSLTVRCKDTTVKCPECKNISKKAYNCLEKIN